MVQGIMSSIANFATLIVNGKLFLGPYSSRMLISIQIPILLVSQESQEMPCGRSSSPSLLASL